MVQFTHGVTFVALICIVCGVAMTGVSSWILHKGLQAWKNPTLTTARDLLHQVNTFFGGTTGLYDLDVIYRIIISCSGTALIGGGVQFLSSLFLLFCGSSGKMSRGVGVFWVFVQFFVMLAVGGALLCIWTNELELNSSLRIFLISAGVDIIVILAACVIISFSECQGTVRRVGVVNYAIVQKPVPPPKPKPKGENYTANVMEQDMSRYERKQYNGVQVLPLRQQQYQSTTSIV